MRFLARFDGSLPFSFAKLAGRRQPENGLACSSDAAVAWKVWSARVAVALTGTMVKHKARRRVMKEVKRVFISHG